MIYTRIKHLCKNLEKKTYPGDFISTFSPQIPRYIQRYNIILRV